MSLVGILPGCPRKNVRHKVLRCVPLRKDDERIMLPCNLVQKMLLTKITAASTIVV